MCILSQHRRYASPSGSLVPSLVTLAILAALLVALTAFETLYCEGRSKIRAH